MKRNYKDEYKSSYKQALEMAKRYGTSSGIEVYLSFTKYGQKVFRNLNKKLYDDTVLDYELGIISKEEQKVLIDTYSIIENSIAEACIY